MCALDAAPCEFGSGGTWWRDARRTRRSPVVATELWVDPGRRGLAGGSMLRDLGRSFGVLAGGAHVGVVADLVQRGLLPGHTAQVLDEMPGLQPLDERVDDPAGQSGGVDDLLRGERFIAVPGDLDQHGVHVAVPEERFGVFGGNRVDRRHAPSVSYASDAADWSAEVCCVSDRRNIELGSECDIY